MRSFGLAIAVVASLVVTLGCGDERQTTITPAVEGVRSQDVDAVDPAAVDAEAKVLLAQLEGAYQSSSDDELLAFFRRWHDSVKPVDMDDVTHPLERELYGVYLRLFRPLHLDEITGSWSQDSNETFKGTYSRVRYIIVPTLLKFQVNKEGSKQTLGDFRPPVQAKPAEVLFLTPAYEKALTTFLESGSPGDATTDQEKSDARVSDTVRRIKFLNRVVRIEPGHWDGWDLLSYPSDVQIEFSNNMTEAVVSFSVFSLSGIATMKRESGKWRIEDSGMEGIQ